MSCRSLRELQLFVGSFLGLTPQALCWRSLRELKAVSDFELDFVSLVPMVCKAVAVPIIGDLFYRPSI